MNSKDLLRNVPVNKVKEFEADYIAYLNTKHRDVLDKLKLGKYTSDLTDVLEQVAKDVSEKYQ